MSKQTNVIEETIGAVLPNDIDVNATFLELDEATETQSTRSLTDFQCDCRRHCTNGSTGTY